MFAAGHEPKVVAKLHWPKVIVNESRPSVESQILAAPLDIVRKNEE
jgi:translation initiation factor 2B subunit (eIF-2B alpha/beta/delta family)